MPFPSALHLSWVDLANVASTRTSQLPDAHSLLLLESPPWSLALSRLLGTMPAGGRQVPVRKVPTHCLCTHSSTVVCNMRMGYHLTHLETPSCPPFPARHLTLLQKADNPWHIPAWTIHAVSTCAPPSSASAECPLHAAIMLGLR